MGFARSPVFDQPLCGRPYVNVCHIHSTWTYCSGWRITRVILASKNPAFRPRSVGSPLSSQNWLPAFIFCQQFPVFSLKYVLILIIFIQFVRFILRLLTSSVTSASCIFETRFREVYVLFIPNTQPGLLFHDSISTLSLIVVNLVLFIRVSALCRHFRMAYVRPNSDTVAVRWP